MNRRHLLLGASAALLSGCKVLDRATDADSTLHAVFASAQRLTMGSQRLLAGNALAPEFPESEICGGQRPNGSVDPATPAYLTLRDGGFRDYRLTVDGLVDRPLALTYAQLTAMPARTQVTRHDCVEGWSHIAKWTGVPLGAILKAAGPRVSALYAVFHCYDEIERSLSGTVTYYESIDLIDAFHPQTILAHRMNDAPLPVAHGAPLRLRVERHLGYKHAKYIHRIELVDSFAALGRGRGSYWADRGYEWYAGI